MICTDTFGLCIDVRDIALVIEWNVDEKVKMSHLTQRIRRCVRDLELEGHAFVFVQQNIMEAICKDWGDHASGWKDAWEDSDALLEDAVEDEYDKDTVRVVPVSKERKLARFGFPVTRETFEDVRRHTRALYKEIANLRDVHMEARKEAKGTRVSPVSMAQKVDPTVLWFIATTGCRHQVLAQMFCDLYIFGDNHRYWYCDNCAIQSSKDLSSLGVGRLNAALSMYNPDPVQISGANATGSSAPGPTLDIPVTLHMQTRVRKDLTRT